MSDHYAGASERYTQELWAEKCFRTERRASDVSPHPPTGPDWQDRQEHGA